MSGCADVFNTGRDWLDSRVPSVGTERFDLQRVLRAARGNV